MEFSTIFETIKGFFEANVLPTLKPIIDAIMGLIGGIIGINVFIVLLIGIVSGGK